MKIQILSDLHLDHWGSYLGVNWYTHEFLPAIQTDARVLVVAGDSFSLRVRDLRWTRARLEDLCNRFQDVVYVPGNHEFYGTSIDTGLVGLHEIALYIPNLHVLDLGRAAMIDGRRFLGHTMWFSKNDDALKISDFWCISDFEPFVYEEHARFRNYLEHELTENDIVVTHHAPSVKSIDSQYEGDPHNHYFCVPEMEELIYRRQPLLWVHGHMHTPFDYVIGGTRVICNPQGYPGEGVRFNPKLIVEV